MNNSEQFNPPIGLYTQPTGLYTQIISNLDFNKINEYLSFCLADKKIELKDKLLENVDICLNIINEYEKRGI